eukprot:48904_1
MSTKRNKKKNRGKIKGKGRNNRQPKNKKNKAAKQHHQTTTDNYIDESGCTYPNIKIMDNKDRLHVDSLLTNEIPSKFECPRCTANTIKTQNECVHMTCGNSSCRTEWCDVCGKRLKAEEWKEHKCIQIQNRLHTVIANHGFLIDEPKTDPCMFTNGDIIEITGLKNQTELNGKRGRIVRFDHQSQRYIIFIQKKNIKLKPHNLKKIDENMDITSTKYEAPAKGMSHVATEIDETDEMMKLFEECMGSTDILQPNEPT